MAGSAGLLNSFLSAIQASLSVLLVIFYGAVAARFKLLDSSSTKAISKICVKMFLPALLLTKIGSELHAGSADRYLIILLWAFVCHLASFFIGVAAHYLLGMPDWITAAIMFNNTTSYPLLLIQSLDETGILSNLIITDETSREAIERAKSYFLVFATVSSCLTFAVGPRLIDTEMAPDLPSDKEEDDEEYGYGAAVWSEESHHVNDDDRPVSPSDRTLLLQPEGQALRRNTSAASLSFFPSRRGSTGRRQSVAEDIDTSRAMIYDRRPSIFPKRKWDTVNEDLRWWLLFFYDFLNAPLLGAVLGAIIGLVPVLHRSFFSETHDGGIFSAWLTASLKNVGGLFVPLPVVVAGVSLYTAMHRVKTGDHVADTPWATTLFVLIVRFAIWPLISIGTIFILAKNTTLLGNDPMLWFSLMLMPTGAPAMKLITMVEVSGAGEEDEHKISKLLTVSSFYTKRLPSLPKVPF
ncbi:auxin efflux carrier [Amylocarpus encephaloides]|uniref:Auxin efflux carrier n=1 Tax=Amylocarpus encephaloides TaxID=45428 RepID=A0A9P8C842_9HELO|nr:auxin efflux carrier [Amylocarpus encephaloides]